MKRTILPALTLFLLAPFLAEMLSGSTPPLVMLNPILLLINLAMYGGGAVLAREINARRGNGFLGLLFFGVAYGILEEGVSLMSWFNPAWPDLGRDAVYGWWGGMGWVWAAHLTAYHAVFSILIPVVLVQLIFPETRGKPWLGRWGLITVAMVFLLSLAAGNLLGSALFQFRPEPLPYIGALLAAILLVFIGLRIAPIQPAAELESKTLLPPGCFWMTGFALTIGLFAAGWIFPATPIPPWATITVLVALGVVTVALVGAWLEHGARFTPGRRLALAAGGLTFFILFTPVTEARGVDPAIGEDPRGMLCVGLLAVAGLILLAVRIHRSGRNVGLPQDTVP